MVVSGNSTGTCASLNKEINYSIRTNHSSIDIDVTFSFHKSQNLFFVPQTMFFVKNRKTQHPVKMANIFH